MSLQDQLQTLYQLDLRIKALRTRVDGATRRRNAQANKLAQFERQHSEVEQQLKEAKAAVAASENDANTIEARIDTLRKTMSTVRNNKEYSALLVEVNTLKIDQEKHEEKALEHMTRVEDMQAKADEIQAKADDQRKLVEHSESEMKEASGEISEQLDEVQKEREQAAAVVDEQVLTQYQKLMDDFDDEAMGEVEEQDRRRMEYTCGACYMSLPIQVVNATLTATDKPVVCPSCDRILYVPDQLREALAPK